MRAETASQKFKRWLEKGRPMPFGAATPKDKSPSHRSERRNLGKLIYQDKNKS